MDDLRITRHGEKRTRQRVGIPKKAISRNAQKALDHGIGVSEATGKLKGYIEFLYAVNGGSANNIRIYNDKVYVFHNKVLVTVHNIPYEHRKQAIYQQRAKHE